MKWNMIGKLINLDDNRPHKVSEVICLKCLYRWVAVRPVGTPLKNLQCPKCGYMCAIETGEEIADE